LSGTVARLSLFSYLKKVCLPVALAALKTVMLKKKSFIVTDTFLYKNGYALPITDKLAEMGIVHTTFFNVAPDPTLACAKEGVGVGVLGTNISNSSVIPCIFAEHILS
jgi:alcohol dehydrogenase class IV